jgi:hypothetical protein
MSEKIYTTVLSYLVPVSGVVTTDRSRWLITKSASSCSFAAIVLLYRGISMLH